MIDVMCKRWLDNPETNNSVGSFMEVTVESIANKAILIGYHNSKERMVIYADEVDNAIAALQELRGYIR